MDGNSCSLAAFFKIMVTASDSSQYKTLPLKEARHIFAAGTA